LVGRASKNWMASEKTVVFTPSATVLRLHCKTQRRPCRKAVFPPVCDYRW
jgi:hypothetical protein